MDDFVDCDIERISNEIDNEDDDESFIKVGNADSFIEVGKDDSFINVSMSEGAGEGEVAAGDGIEGVVAAGVGIEDGVAAGVGIEDGVAAGVGIEDGVAAGDAGKGVDAGEAEDDSFIDVNIYLDELKKLDKQINMEVKERMPERVPDEGIIKNIKATLKTALHETPNFFYKYITPEHSNELERYKRDKHCFNNMWRKLTNKKLENKLHTIDILFKTLIKKDIKDIKILLADGNYKTIFDSYRLVLSKIHDLKRVLNKDMKFSKPTEEELAEINKAIKNIENFELIF